MYPFAFWLAGAIQGPPSSLELSEPLDGQVLG